MEYGGKNLWETDESGLLLSARLLETKLNALHDAQKASDVTRAEQLEQEIVSMATPDLYEGYIKGGPDKDEEEWGCCEVLGVKRRGGDADMHTFYVAYRRPDRDVTKIHEMDLMDFLMPVKITVGFEGVHWKPRFLSETTASDD